MGLLKIVSSVAWRVCALNYVCILVRMHISAHDPVFKLLRLAACAADLAALNKELQSIRTLNNYYDVTSECLISCMDSLCTQ